MPVAVAGGLTFTEIATYGDHACALVSGGQAYCWGANLTGELGDSTIVEGCGNYGCSTTPVPAASDHVFTQIVAGLSFTCGLGDDAQAWCWGNAGKIGGPNLGAPGAAVPAGQRLFASLTAGTDHACALTPEGKAYCWGANDRGQTGQSPGSATLAPVEVRQGKTYTALDAGKQPHVRAHGGRALLLGRQWIQPARRTARRAGGPVPGDGAGAVVIQRVCLIAA